MKQFLFYLFALFLLGGCSSGQPPVATGQIDEIPEIYPDYAGVTIPATIAPLNFSVCGFENAYAIFKTDGFTCPVYASNGTVSIPESDWKSLLEAAKGKQVEVSVILLCTTTSYGTFPIWHKDADLCMFDLSTGEQISTEQANSPDTDSYHSWSSNSRWVVFSSRRLDGLYTRPFIAHVDEGGVLSKPFLLPQQSTNYYTLLTKSYNIPEFIKGKVKTNRYKLATQIKEGKNSKVTFMRKDFQYN